MYYDNKIDLRIVLSKMTSACTCKGSSFFVCSIFYGLQYDPKRMNVRSSLVLNPLDSHTYADRRSVIDLDKKVKRYYQLKQQQKEIEQELSELRSDIINHCNQQGVTELGIGNIHVKLVRQERKEYDDSKLYHALPDPDVWRMLSKADPAKIASLIKLNVITEEKIKNTFLIKQVTLLQVDKK